MYKCNLPEPMSVHAHVNTHCAMIVPTEGALWIPTPPVVRPVVFKWKVRAYNQGKYLQRAWCWCIHCVKYGSIDVVLDKHMIPRNWLARYTCVYAICTFYNSQLRSIHLWYCLSRDMHILSFVQVKGKTDKDWDHWPTSKTSCANKLWITLMRSGDATL